MTHRNITCACLVLAAVLALLLQAGCGKQKEEQAPEPEAESPRTPPPPPSYNDRLGALAAKALETVQAEEDFDREKYLRAKDIAGRLRTYDYGRPERIPDIPGGLNGKGRSCVSPFLTPEALPPDTNLQSMTREIAQMGRPAVPALLEEFTSTADVELRKHLLAPLAKIPQGLDLFLPFVLEILEHDRGRSLRRAAIDTTQTLLLESDNPRTLAEALLPELVAISSRTKRFDTAQAALSQVYEFQIRGCELSSDQVATLEEGLKEAEPTDRRAVLAARCLLEQGEEAGRDFLLETLAESGELISLGDARSRELALWTLHLFGEKRVSTADEAAIKLLHDARDAEVRQAAAWALGRMAADDNKKGKIVKALEEVLREEKDPAVFKEIADTLADIGGEDSFRILLKDSQNGETDLQRLYSVNALITALEGDRIPAELAAEIVADFRLRAQKEKGSSLRLRYVGALGAVSAAEYKGLHDEVMAELVSIMNHDPQFCIRAEAATALGRFSGPVTDLLEALRGEKVEYVKLNIIRALGERHSPGALAPLVEAVKNGSRTLVTACAEALPGIEGFTPACLFREYLSPGASEGAKKNILVCLRRMDYGDEIARFLLDEALPIERDAARRAEIVLDIGRRLDPGHPLRPGAVTRFREILRKESDTEAMGALINVLGAFKSSGALEEIIGAAERNERVMPQAIRALTHIGDPRALDFFLKMLSKITFDNYQIYRTQAEAIAAAVNHFDRSAVSERIGRVCYDSSQAPAIRGAAMTLAYVLDDPEMDEYLLKTAESKGEPLAVRRGAILGMAFRKYREAIPALKDMMKSEEPEIARSAAFALGAIGDVRAFMPLLNVLKDLRDGPPEKRPLRDMAVFSLRQLTGEQHGDNIYAWEKWYRQHVNEGEE
ncbi:MAG: hypothetical protein DRP79_00390 [Planctomycetota bacterium]|nr:MAG: hypothetical protein DRP79_00390 [Planctomycetota bacterium]